MSWAMEQQIVTDASARHVLLCLANYADHDGKAAFPSTAKLERDTGLSESTIRRKLDSLEELGMIAKGNQSIVAAYIDRADKRPICYDIQMKKPGSTVNPRSERGVTVTPTGCHGDADGVSMAQERGSTVTPNTSFNPSFNPPLNQKRSSDRADALVAGAEKKASTLTGETWNAYESAYERRYGTKPVRNATVNAQVANFVKRLGGTEAPAVAAFYVSHNNRFYVQTMHSAGAMAKDAEKLRTEWATSTRVTETKAREADRLQTSGDMWSRLIEQAEVANGGR
jgi:hypothetical protein